MRAGSAPAVLRGQREIRAVGTVLIGARSTAETAEDLGPADTVIPDELWEEPDAR